MVSGVGEDINGRESRLSTEQAFSRGEVLKGLNPGQLRQRMIANLFTDKPLKGDLPSLLATELQVLFRAQPFRHWRVPTWCDQSVAIMDCIMP